MGRRKKFQRTSEGRRETGGSGRPIEEYRAHVRESPKFEEYYKALGIVPAEEWDQFIATLRKPLPTTFRITKGSPFTEAIKHKLFTEFASEGPLTLDDGTVVAPPSPLPWYPGQEGWYCSASKKDLRKAAGLAELHRFLVAQTETGETSRQEAVSMIPPFFLRVQPTDTVLDMCASPGSKTAQLLEWLHAEDKTVPPSGLVVANDANLDRCYLLTHQVQRLSSSCFMVSLHEGQHFPLLKVIPEQSYPLELIEQRTHDGRITFQFDKILCDVPCSGDGTLRKTPELWPRWNVGMGLGLHKLQVMIAERCAKLLKIGGRMVYSTCSLNPIEDEAVLVQLIRSCKGAIQLVDASNELPSLKRRPGVINWQVQDKKGNWHKSFEEIAPDDPAKQYLLPSMFPPHHEESKDFGLEKSMRFFPHFQDTGGFFVAVLQKVKPMIWTPSVNSLEQNNPKNQKEEADSESSGVSQRVLEEKPHKVKYSGPEEPFLPLSDGMASVVHSISEFYGLSANFPASQLYVRSEKTPPKQFYFLSSGVHKLFEAAEQTERPLRVVNMGVKMFAQHKGHGTYRLSQMGLKWILPYVTKRIVQISEDDLLTLLESTDPFFNTFSAGVQAALSDLNEGGVVFVVDRDCKTKCLAGMPFSGWRGKVSAHLLVPKTELAGLAFWAKRLHLSDKLPDSTEEAIQRE